MQTNLIEFFMQHTNNSMEFIRFAIDNPNFKHIHNLVAYISSHPDCVEYILANKNGLKINDDYIAWCVYSLAINIGMVDYIIDHPEGFETDTILTKWNINCLSYNVGMTNYIINNKDGFHAKKWNILSLSQNTGMIKYILANKIGFETSKKIYEWNIDGLSTNSGMAYYILNNLHGIQLSDANNKITPWNIKALTVNSGMIDYIFNTINTMLWDYDNLEQNTGIIDIVLNNPSGIKINNEIRPWNVLNLSTNPCMAELIMNQYNELPANKLFDWQSFPLYYCEKQSHKLYKNANKLI